MREEIKKGRPRYRWKEQVKKNIEKRGTKWMEMTEEETLNDAKNRLRRMSRKEELNEWK